MKQLDTAIIIVTALLYMFGGPFFLLMEEALTTNNQMLMAQIIPLGFGIAFICLMVLIIGVWLDGFC